MQINGKLRSRVKVPHHAGTEDIESLVKTDTKVATILQETTIRKIIHVPGKLVNIVTGEVT